MQEPGGGPAPALSGVSGRFCRIGLTILEEKGFDGLRFFRKSYEGVNKKIFAKTNIFWCETALPATDGAVGHPRVVLPGAGFAAKKGRRPAPWRFPFGIPSCGRAAARTVVASAGAGCLRRVRCFRHTPLRRERHYSNSFITDSILRRISSVQSRPMLPSWVWSTSLTGRYSPRWTSMPTRR